MPDTLALWHTEHANFARLLNLLDDQLALFHDAGAPDYELMQEIMFYMTHYSDVLHPPKEDLVFAKIRERDAAVAEVIDALAAQHRHLKSAGEHLTGQLDEIVNGTISSRAEIEASARDYIDTLRRHMRIEETQILPLAERLLSAPDWNAIHAAIGRVEDPLFGKHPERRYASLQQQIARHAPPPPR